MTARPSARCLNRAGAREVSIRHGFRRREKRIAIIAGLRDARGARLNEDRRTRRARIGLGSGSDRAQKMGRPAAPAAAIASAARVGRRSPGAAPEGTGRRLGGIADAGGSRGAAS
ncbi:aromatic ring-opening dioxygenase LigA, partial [Burkholderia pseudomallei]